jgi:hypothetical protein
MAGKSVENQIEHLRPYIIAMMKRDGRDFTKCELNGEDIPEGEFILHHTKYDGATYKDMKIVCRSCNNKAENQLLD